MSKVKSESETWYKKDSKPNFPKRHKSISERLAQTEELDLTFGELTKGDLENLGISLEKEDSSLFD